MLIFFFHMLKGELWDSKFYWTSGGTLGKKMVKIMHEPPDNVYWDLIFEKSLFHIICNCKAFHLYGFLSDQRTCSAHWIFDCMSFKTCIGKLFSFLYGTFSWIPRQQNLCYQKLPLGWRRCLYFQNFSLWIF